MRVWATSFFSTFHLLYILIYSHSILFHSVPFSISFNVFFSLLLVQPFKDYFVCVCIVFFTQLFSFILNEKEEKKKIISVVLIEALAAWLVLLLLLLLFAIAFSSFVFCFTNEYLSISWQSTMVFEQKKIIHIEKSSANTLFKMYTLCYSFGSHQHLFRSLWK